MNVLAVDLRHYWPTVLRLLAIALLIAVEAEAVEIALRRFFDGSNYQTSFWAPAWNYRPYFLAFFILFVPVLVVAMGARSRSHLYSLVQAADRYPWARILGLQILSYLVFAALTYLLSARYHELGSLRLAVIAAWGLASLATVSLSLLSIAPRHFWGDFGRRERLTLLASAVISIGTVGFVVVARHLSWIGDATFRMSEIILRWFYSDVRVNAQTHELGTAGFQVTIAKECSGYEGIVLVVVFLGLYLWVFRRDFRFPQTLFLFPIGILVIWAFNALRIATLIAIGTDLSPEVAVAGFHSNAGWIAFILVTFALIWAAHRVPVFAMTSAALPARAGPTIGNRTPASESEAQLVPFVVLLASTLLTSAFSAGFDWLYPVKVAATGAALWFFWRYYRFAQWPVTALPVLVGTLVFLGWVLLVPVSNEANTAFAEGLAAAPTLGAGTWLMFRFIGSAITVPFAEELAFRGYLLGRLSGAKPTTDGRVPFTWLSFVASSVAFGVFHDAWIAGTLAGMAYAYVRYHRGAVSDAIVAHMTTNTLLSAYVMLTQQWSYW